ncbi:LytTr DNA-binding domain protein [compost metagenome]
MNDIVYIESLKDYIKINMVGDKNITSKYKIGDIQQELNEDNFLRIHRSFIINTSKITAFTMNEIEVSNIEIPIGASYKEDVLLYLKTLKNSK